MPKNLPHRPPSTHQPHQPLLPFDPSDQTSPLLTDDTIGTVLPTDVWRTLSLPLQAQVFQRFRQVTQTLLQEVSPHADFSEYS